MATIWDHSPYKGSDLLILLALADMANDAGRCWPSIPTIAQRARLSERQTMIILKRLKENQAIQWTNRAGSSNIYTVVSPAPLNPDSPLNSDSGVRPDSPLPLNPDSPTPESGFTPPLNPDSPKPLLNHHINHQDEPSLLLQPDGSDTAEPDGAGHCPEPVVVVVVGTDGVEWPLDEIKNTAGLTFSFRDTSQAKTYISKWLYALSPEGSGINTPARWAKAHMDDDPDPRYLEIVEAGPTRITTSYWGAGAHVEALRKAGVATLLTKMIPSLAQPEPETQDRPQDDEPVEDVPNPNPRIFTLNGLPLAPSKAWESAIGQIRRDTPQRSFYEWVSKAVLLDYDQNVFLVGFPTELERDGFMSRFGSTTTRLLTGITNKSVELQVTTWDKWETSE